MTYPDVDRRRGLPDSRPPSDRAERRQAVIDSHRERAASQEWLRRFLARHLERVAYRLEQEQQGAAAATVRDVASGVRDGSASLW